MYTAQSVYFINLSLPSTALYVDTVYCFTSSIICTVCLASLSYLCLCNSVHLDAVQTLSFTQWLDIHHICSCCFSGPYRKDFEELFDIIITNALKPGFFSLVPQQRPFRTLGEYWPPPLHASVHFICHLINHLVF